MNDDWLGSKNRAVDRHAFATPKGRTRLAGTFSGFNRDNGSDPAEPAQPKRVGIPSITSLSKALAGWLAC
jgi:hypothetical protein